MHFGIARMWASRIVSSIALTAIASGCDPIAGVTLHQRLGPVPSTCIDSALSGAPGVLGALRSDAATQAKQYSLTLAQPESLAARGAMPLRAEIRHMPGDTIDLALRVWYFGAATGRITPDMVRRSVASATPIAVHVRRLCGGATPADLTCRVEGFGRSRVCEPAT